MLPIRYFIQLILFYSFLCIVYSDIIVQYWGYFNFSNDSATFKRIFADILFIALAFITSFFGSKSWIKSLFEGLLFVFVISPIIIYFRFNDGAEFYSLTVYVLSYIIIFFTLKYSRSIIFKVRFLKMSLFYSLLLASIFVAIPLLILITSGGFSNWNLVLEDVYLFRDSPTNEKVLTGILAYLTMWSLTVFGSYILLIGIRKKSIITVLSLLFIYFLWFGMTGHKSFIGYPLLTLLLYFMLRWLFAMQKIVLYLTVGVVFFYVVDLLVLDLPVLTSTFTRRVLFIPANTAFAYIDFFSSSNFVYWSNSFLSSFINYPYDRHPSLLVGDFMGDPTMVANNSFLSTAYMHFGIVGTAIYSFMFVALIEFLDFNFRSHTSENRMRVALIGLPLFQLITSSDFLTAFLTHGIGIGLVVIMIFKFR